MSQRVDQAPLWPMAVLAVLGAGLIALGRRLAS